MHNTHYGISVGNNTIIQRHNILVCLQIQNIYYLYRLYVAQIYVAIDMHTAEEAVNSVIIVRLCTPSYCLTQGKQQTLSLGTSVVDPLVDSGSDQKSSVNSLT